MRSFYSLIFNGRYLASGSADETIRIGNLQTGQTERILQAAGLYEGMNINRIQGLSEDAIATLKQLRAIESL